MVMVSHSGKRGKADEEGGNYNFLPAFQFLPAEPGPLHLGYCYPAVVIFILTNTGQKHHIKRNCSQAWRSCTG